MAELQNTFQIAIGLFDTADRLSEVIDDLLGFESAQFCALGKSKVLPKFLKPLIGSGANKSTEKRQGWFGEPKPIAFLSEYLATSGSEFEPLLRPPMQVETTQMKFGTCPLGSELSGRLEISLSQGSVSCIVNARNADQLEQAARAFLKFSSPIVQTHSFTWQ